MGATDLAHIIAKGETVGEVVVERGVGGPGIFCLRVVCRQGRLRGQGILVGDAVLGPHVLEDLLVDVQLGRRVGETVGIIRTQRAVGEIRLRVAGNAAIASVRRTVRARVFGTGTVGAITLAFVGDIAV